MVPLLLDVVSFFILECVFFLWFRRMHNHMSKISYVSDIFQAVRLHVSRTKLWLEIYRTVSERKSLKISNKIQIGAYNRLNTSEEGAIYFPIRVDSSWLNVSYVLFLHIITSTHSFFVSGGRFDPSAKLKVGVEIEGREIREVREVKDSCKLTTQSSESPMDLWISGVYVCWGPILYPRCGYNSNRWSIDVAKEYLWICGSVCLATTAKPFANKTNTKHQAPRTPGAKTAMIQQR